MSRLSELLRSVRGHFVCRVLAAAMVGGMLGALISVFTNNALAEISISPFFAMAYGVILLMLGSLLIWRKLWERHNFPVARVWVLGFSLLVLCSGVSCFLLERDFNSKLSYARKVPLYIMLGIALSFTMSCTLVDMVNLAVDRCSDSYALPLVWTPRQISLILAGAVVIGAAVGLMFGVMDVEDHLYRLQHEGWVLIGICGVSGSITGAANALLTTGRHSGGLGERSELNRAAHDAT